MCARVCAYVCVPTCVSERGLVLEQFVQQGSVTVANAHGGWCDVLEDVYSPAEAPVHVVGVPRRVALPGHVNLYQWAFGLGGWGRGPHLEDR